MPDVFLTPRLDSDGAKPAATFRGMTPVGTTDHGEAINSTIFPQEDPRLDAASGQEESSYITDNYIGTLPDGSVINTVAFAGAFAVENTKSATIQPFVVSAGVRMDVGSPVSVPNTLSTSYGYYLGAPTINVNTNPFTGNPWTTAELDDTEFGYEIASASGGIRYKWLQVNVNYSAAPIAPPSLAVDPRAFPFVKNGGAQEPVPEGVVTNDDNVTSLTVQIERNFQAGVDVLACGDADGITCVFADDTLTMTGSATAANYQARLRAMTFDTGADPANRTIRLLIQAFDAQGASNLAEKFIRIGPPVIEFGPGGVSPIDPDNGPTAGGTPVVVTGEGFAATADFWFDNDIATSIVVVSHTRLECVTPAHVLGLVAVSTSNDGLEYAELADAYTYVPPTPQITSIDPQEGPVGGGTACTIGGTNFAEGCEVYFGDRLADNIIVVSDTEITCDAPPNKVGLVDVTVKINPESTLFEAFRYTFIGDYLVRREPNIVVSDMLNDAPNSARFTVDGEEDDGMPTAGEPFEIQVDASGKLFKGTVQSVTQNYEERTNGARQLNWDLVGVDNTWLANRRRPFGRFEDVSISVIAETLIEDYAPDFTHDHVQQDLIEVSITFDGSETLAEALTRLCQLGGPIKWYIDYDDDLHLFYDTPPDPPTNGLPAPTTELVPTLSGNAPANSFLPGYYLFKQAFEYSDGRLSDYGPFSDPIFLDGTESVNLAGLEIGAPVGALTVVKRRVFVRALWISFNGEMRRNILWTDVADNTTTSQANTEPGWALTGLRYGPASRKNGTPPTPGTFTVTPGPPVVNVTHTAGRFAFKMVAVYRNDVESPPSTISNVDDYLSTESYDFSSVPTPADFNGYDVVYRKFYYSFAYSGTPTFLSNVTNGHYWVPNNTDTSFNDPMDTADYRAFNEQPSKTAHENGPDLEDDPDPDDLTDENTDLLKDPPITMTVDNSQIRNRVFVKGKGTTVDTDTASGGSALPLNDVSFFPTAGGQVFVGWRVLNYTGVSGSNLDLSENLDEDIPAGTAVHLWVQRDDYAAQSDLAAVEGGDGVHEFLIADDTLVEIEAMEERGDAELSVYSRGIVTVSYSTRDRKSKSGKNIVIDLSDPPISATLKIQEVTIDQIHEADNLVERYRVTASSVRFTIDDFLRRVQLTR